MAKSSYTLIVPPKLETELTGFFGGIEKTLRGVTYKANLYGGGWEIFRDGQKVRSWDDMPPRILKYAREAKAILRPGW